MAWVALSGRGVDLGGLGVVWGGPVTIAHPQRLQQALGERVRYEKDILHRRYDSVVPTDTILMGDHKPQLTPQLLKPCSFDNHKTSTTFQTLQF